MNEDILIYLISNRLKTASIAKIAKTAEIAKKVKIDSYGKFDWQ